jgi:hypothetical protein
MTIYEMMGVQSTYADLLSTSYKFWTTTTFALVAAAYVAGPQLGMWITIGISSVYFALAMGNVVSVRLYTATVAGTVEDLKLLEKETDQSWATTKPGIAAPAFIIAPLLITIMVFGSIGAVCYLLYRADLLT